MEWKYDEVHGYSECSPYQITHLQPNRFELCREEAGVHETIGEYPTLEEAKEAAKQIALIDGWFATVVGK